MSGATIVTGAAGFIGRNTVAELNKRGVADLVLVDRLGADEKWKNLVSLEFDEFLSPEQLWEWLDHNSSVDAVIHLGACSSTIETDAEFLIENNFRYTKRLCEWAVTHSARFVYASSAATYGDGALGFNDEDESTRTLVPLNMYGYSKHAFDLWALRQGHLAEIVGLKFFNVFGPHEDHKGAMRSVVAKAYEEIEANGKISLFKSYRDGIADGEQRRDFIYVDDVVDVVLHFLENRRSSGLFNCGTGVARTWLALASAVFVSLDRPPTIDFIDMPPELRSKYQYLTQAQMVKLRATGYGREFRSLEVGVDDYIRTYLSVERLGGS